MAGDIIYQVLSAVLTVFLLVATASSQVARDAKELDIKLTGGSHSFQGYLQVYHEGSWYLVCPTGWSREASDLVCKKLGLLGKAMTEMSSKSYEKDDHPTMAVQYRCYSNNATWTDCVPGWQQTCSLDTAIKVECALPNYIGCLSDSENEHQLKGKVATGLDGLTIAGCLSSCREEGFVYGGLVSQDTCLCGSAGEEVEKLNKLNDDQCTEGCSGSGLQACGKTNKAAAVYDVSIGNCGGRIKAKEGVVASPGFPENYSTENPKVCQWIIDLSENGDTIVDFPMFDLDPNEDDQLEVSEDDGVTWRSYTSSVLPEKMVTSSQTLRLRFTILARNGGVEGGNSKGFLVSFTDYTTCEFIYVVNGTLEMEDDKEYRPDEKVGLSCEDGYLPNYNLILCQSNGKWYPAPKCEEGRSMMPSLVFTTTLLYMMVTFVGVLGFIILSIICAMMCIRSKKKSEGYKGISSGESGYHKGPDDIDEKDHKIEMQDGIPDDDGMDMMHSNAQSIPLATTCE